MPSGVDCDDGVGDEEVLMIVPFQNPRSGWKPRSAGWIFLRAFQPRRPQCLLFKCRVFSFNDSIIEAFRRPEDKRGLQCLPIALHHNGHAVALPVTSE